VLKSAASISLYRSRHNATSEQKAEFGRDGILTLLEGAVTLEAADVRLIVAVAELLHPLASLFVPLFFVLMGTQVDLGSLGSLATLGFGMVLILCAFVGKLACALGVLGGGIDRLAVAIGMIPRGEVGLIFAGIGTTLSLDGQPLLSQGLFSAVVLMVLVTTLVTPVGLRWIFQPRGS